MKSSQASITAVVIAGGLGRRMGGCDKGLLPLRGRPLVTYILDILRPHADRVLLNTTNAAYTQFGHPLIDDAIDGRIGPLAGLLAALEATPPGDLVLSVPCDTPQLPADLVPRLLKALEHHDACCAFDGERLHPVIALWRPTLAPRLRAYLESGERRVRGWLDSVDYSTALFPPENLANVNTPGDLEVLS